MYSIHRNKLNRAALFKKEGSIVIRKLKYASFITVDQTERMFIIEKFPTAKCAFFPFLCSSQSYLGQLLRRQVILSGCFAMTMEFTVDYIQLQFSYFILFHSTSIFFHSIKRHFFQFHLMAFQFTSFLLIPFHSIPLYLIPPHFIQFQPIPCNKISLLSIPPHFISPHFIPLQSSPSHLHPFHPAWTHSIPLTSIPSHFNPLHSLQFSLLNYIQFHYILGNVIKPNKL